MWRGERGCCDSIREAVECGDKSPHSTASQGVVPDYILGANRAAIGLPACGLFSL